MIAWSSGPIAQIDLSIVFANSAARRLRGRAGAEPQSPDPRVRNARSDPWRKDGGSFAKPQAAWALRGKMKKTDAKGGPLIVRLSALRVGMRKCNGFDPFENGHIRVFVVDPFPPPLQLDRDGARRNFDVARQLSGVSVRQRECYHFRSARHTHTTPRSRSRSSAASWRATHEGLPARLSIQNGFTEKRVSAEVHFCLSPHYLDRNLTFWMLSPLPASI